MIPFEDVWSEIFLDSDSTRAPTISSRFDALVRCAEWSVEVLDSPRLEMPLRSWLCDGRKGRGLCFLVVAPGTGSWADGGCNMNICDETSVVGSGLQVWASRASDSTTRAISTQGRYFCITCHEARLPWSSWSKVYFDCINHYTLSPWGRDYVDSV